MRIYKKNKQKTGTFSAVVRERQWTSRRHIQEEGILYDYQCVRLQSNEHEDEDDEDSDDGYDVFSIYSEFKEPDVYCTAFLFLVVQHHELGGKSKRECDP
jgi:hypothetical protein